MSKLTGNPIKDVYFCSRLRRGASIHHYSVCLSDGVYFRYKALLLVARVPLFIRESRQNLSRQKKTKKNRQLREKREPLQMSPFWCVFSPWRSIQHDGLLQRPVVSMDIDTADVLFVLCVRVIALDFFPQALRLLTSFSRQSLVFCADRHTRADLYYSGNNLFPPRLEMFESQRHT